MPFKLYAGSDRFAWHCQRWPELAEKEAIGEALLILPIYSLSDWALGRPLDAEELVGAFCLDEALKALPSASDFFVAPPMRLTPTQSIGTCFGLDLEAGHRIVEEVVVSAASAGLRRFVFFNTSPFLEEWVDVAARDLRVQHDYQTFCINLSGLGLDFHPQRGADRSGLQAILTDLLGTPPEVAGPFPAEDLDTVPAVIGSSSPALRSEGRTAAEWVAGVAGNLATLLEAVRAHPRPPSRAPSTEGRE